MSRKQLNGGVSSRRSSMPRGDYVSPSNQVPDRSVLEPKPSFTQDRARRGSQSSAYSAHESKKHLEDSRHRPGSASTSSYDDNRIYIEPAYPNEKETNRFVNLDFIKIFSKFWKLNECVLVCVLNF